MSRTLLPALLSLPLVMATGCGEADSEEIVGTATAGECAGSPYEDSARTAAPTSDTGSADTGAGDTGAGDTGAPVDGSVEISVVDGVIQLEYAELIANCCPSPGVEVEAVTGGLDVDLLDVTADEACGCVCITDFSVEVPDVSPGDYLVRASFNGQLVGSADVVVD